MESLITILTDTRNYLIGQMIADEKTGRRNSLDEDRALLVTRIEVVLCHLKSEFY